MLKFHFVKPVTATFLFVLFVFSLPAKVILVKNALQTDIVKVISDYPNGYKNIIGQQIIENAQRVEFECLIKVKSAIKCKLIRYSSSVKEIYSWDADGENG